MNSMTGLAIDFQSLRGVSIYLGILGVVLFVILRSSRNRYARGPRPFPVFGNFGTLRKLHKNPDQTLMQIRKQWGNMCMLWYGSSPVLIVNSPKVVRELLNEVCESEARNPWAKFAVSIRVGHEAVCQSILTKWKL